MKYFLNARWLQGLKTEDEKQKRADLVLNSTAVLDALASVVESEIQSLDQTSLDDYDCPSWSHKEADRKGQLRAYRNILAMTKRTPSNG